MRTTNLLVVTFSTLGLVIGACSSSSSTSAPSTTLSTSAAVSGAQDTHCASKVQAINEASCHPAPADPTDGGADDAGSSADPPAHELSATLYNSEGDDDDCKLHVKWTSTTVAQKQDVNLQIVATTKGDGKALHGASVRLEVFLDETHPAPTTTMTTKESPDGTYLVGPVHFDAAGKWTVRIHFNEDCSDSSEDSPHAHVAFFVNVP